VAGMRSVCFVTPATHCWHPAPHLLAVDVRLRRMDVLCRDVRYPSALARIMATTVLHYLRTVMENGLTLYAIALHLPSHSCTITYIIHHSAVEELYCVKTLTIYSRTGHCSPSNGSLCAFGLPTAVPPRDCSLVAPATPQPERSTCRTQRVLAPDVPLIGELCWCYLRRGGWFGNSLLHHSVSSVRLQGLRLGAPPHSPHLPSTTPAYTHPRPATPSPALGRLLRAFRMPDSSGVAAVDGFCVERVPRTARVLRALHVYAWRCPRPARRMAWQVLLGLHLAVLLMCSCLLIYAYAGRGDCQTPPRWITTVPPRYYRTVAAAFLCS